MLEAENLPQNVRNVKISVFLCSTGRVEFMEIKQSLADLGLDISIEEAQKILQRYFCLSCSCYSFGKVTLQYSVGSKELVWS